ncbi:ABC-type transporter MlaC component [Zavarzinia compransoris]|nr:ABC-type transporter MlaC component [Zavarzinia compransoris]
MQWNPWQALPVPKTAGRAACWLAFAMAIAAGPAAHATPGPEQAIAYVRAEAAEGIGILGDARLTPDQRREKFRTFLMAALDVKAIGQYVCGSYWAKAGDDQRTRFYAVFEGALLRTYIDLLDDYSGQSVDVSEAKAAGDIMVVTTSVTGGSSQDTRSLDWEVLESGRTLKLFDIVVDGVSTTDTTREDYLAVLRQAGGDLDALIARLPPATP